MTQRFGLFDSNGFPRAFYSDQDHSDIPVAAVQITDQQWREFLQHQGARAFRNSQVVPATPTPPVPKPPADIVTQKMANDPVFAAFVEVVEDITSTPAIEALIISKLAAP